MISEIDDGENEIVFRTNETLDEINRSFDLIIYPMANFFAVEHAESMERIAENISKLKIPVYIISCGVQTKGYDGLDSLIEKIGEPSKKFISAVYSTGGEFSLRGNFTKEFFSRLSFNSAVVTGCPSMYQMGRNFKVNRQKVSKENFNPVFNGMYQKFAKAMSAYPKSAYIDQDLFAYYLLDSTAFDIQSIKSKLHFFRNYGSEAAWMILQNKVKLICNTNDWHSYIKSNFNYSFGTKIHGSIMAILAGIPATVVTIDTRTEEMADFFDIPHIPIKSKKRFSPEDIYEAYLNADYTKFNNSFEAKFNIYEGFLKKHKTVTEINEHNKFFNPKTVKCEFDEPSVNAEKAALLYCELSKKKPVYRLGAKLLDIKESLGKH